ncbi:MAG: 50S ribosomal protein L15 [Gammaproteobacteria bacterium]|nr:50S ribosomal protein L15 [Gammaproteobacteria bacterium]
MRLNTIKPTTGAKTAKKRVGRGGGSGLGKTCGRGHKGQTARAGGFHKLGFEGGQMPLQRRIPKSGFISHLALESAELPLSALNKIDAPIIDIAALRNANLISRSIKRVKIMLSGSIGKSITLKGIKATAGARKSIEAAGGKVEA